MAATVQGTAHLFGMSGTQSNCTVLSFREKEHPANKAQTENETGNVIERRRDDVTKEATITLRQRTDWTKPAIGDVIVYNGTYYEVDDIAKSATNKGYRESTLNLITSEGIVID